MSLPPGTLLREDELMLRLGVGRTPVREAVQRLQRDGFVTVIPRRGTLVSEISITDLAAIYEVRKQLESWASRLAAERALKDDHAMARALIAELDALTAHDDYTTLLRVDRGIHRFVYRTTKNPFLAETLDQYQNLSLRILHVAMKRYPPLTPKLDDVVAEQRTVLDADLSRRRRDRGACRDRAHLDVRARNQRDHLDRRRLGDDYVMRCR